MHACAVAVAAFANDVSPPFYHHLLLSESRVSKTSLNLSGAAHDVSSGCVSVDAVPIPLVTGDASTWSDVAHGPATATGLMEAGLPVIKSSHATTAHPWFLRWTEHLKGRCGNSWADVGPIMQSCLLGVVRDAANALQSHDNALCT